MEWRDTERGSNYGKRKWREDVREGRMEARWVGIHTWRQGGMLTSESTAMPSTRSVQG